MGYGPPAGIAAKLVHPDTNEASDAVEGFVKLTQAKDALLEEIKANVAAKIAPRHSGPAKAKKEG